MSKAHPFTNIFTAFVLFMMVMIYSHPLYVLSILVFIIMQIAFLKGGQQLKSTLRYAWKMAIPILIINPLVSQAGRTVLFYTARLPIIGRIKVTMESIAFGVNMVLKLVCVLLIFTAYEVMADKDDTFTLFSRYAHKWMLVLAMTTNIIHRLKIEVVRVKDVMILRGVNFDHKSLIKRIRAYYPVLKVILISSMEGSLDRAEALYSKKYGKGKRTTYQQIIFDKRDYVIIANSFLLLLSLIFGCIIKVGYYSFYPTLKSFNLKDIYYLLVIILLLIIHIWLYRFYGGEENGDL